MSDLISREQAIALIEEWRQFAHGHNEYGEKLAGCIKAGIEKIPSAEKTGKWIPVTERKPEVEQLVWLYSKRNAPPYNVFVGYLSEDGWWVESGVNFSEYSPPCIVAWQPLNKPEPYNCGARMVEE